MPWATRVSTSSSSTAGSTTTPLPMTGVTQKAGTSSLYEYLRHQPQVFMSTPKELDFFVKTFAWHRGTAWYASQFAGAGDAVAVGEASPSYSAHPSLPGVPERIKATVPS